MDTKKPLIKSILTALFIILAVIVYAYGLTVTDVDFKTTRQEQRLFQLRRIIRTLAHPHLIDYDQEYLQLETPIYLSCPEPAPEPVVPDTTGPYIEIDSQCAGPEEIIEVTGHNIWPESKGTIYFIAVPSGAKINLKVLTTDEEGNFVYEIELPDRAAVEEAQIIRAELTRNVGSPYLSDAAISTWEKILETVFLALIATTFGTLLAIPVSFFAARNLMAEEKSPLSTTALSLICWPLGLALGIVIWQGISYLVEPLSIYEGLSIAGLLVTPVLVWLLLRWALSKANPEETPTAGIKIFRWIAILLAILLTIIFFVSFQNTALLLGNYLKPRLGAFSFLGNFIYQIGDLTQILVPLVIALGTSAVFGSLGGRAGAQIADKMSPAAGKLLNFPLAAIAGAELFAILGAGIDWLYQFDNLALTLWIPAGIGAVLGLVAAFLVDSTTPLPTGMVIYYIIRTILNGTRSVEPLIMVIVFVVWVGIGPFAGALALGLHTIAALAKLFSEQVESILPGPLEAIRATGANRLQTIVYAVVPQIIPPYISFTMYRWDINVRMSTIIGWAGGGGIGFLLSQNIRLLNYRDASVQMIAIAVVVASMDYISSTLRERFV